MTAAVLIVLLCTAVTGIATIGAWMLSADVRRAKTGPGRHRRMPPQLVFGHMVFGVAAVTAWIGFVVVDRAYAGWISLAFMAIAAVLGLVMFIRWIPTYRPRITELRTAEAAQPEQNLPIGIVLAHGGFAVGSVIVALLLLL